MKCVFGVNVVIKEIVLVMFKFDWNVMFDMVVNGFVECMFGFEGKEGVVVFLEKCKLNWVEKVS